MTGKIQSNSFTTSEDTPQPAGPPLIGALLRMSLEIVRARMAERLHERGFDDIGPAHLNVLQYPGPDVTRPTELAARLGMSKQALNYLLGQLEQFGYLERLPDPHDQRSKRIYLTPRGKELRATIRDAVMEIEHEWGQALGSERFDQLRATLAELALHAEARPA